MADAFQLAFLIPNTIYEFIAGGLLSAVFIPILVREQERSGKQSQETWKVANLLLGGVGVILAVTSLIGVLASPWIIEAMTAMGKGTTAVEKQQLATFFFRYFAPQIFLLGVNAIFMAILNSLGIFAVTAAAPILNNIFMIGSFLAYRYGWMNMTEMAIGTTLGTAAMAFIQLPYVLKAGMKIRPRFNLRHPVFRSVTSLGWPIALVSIANLIGWSIRSNLLSTVPGAFSIYTYCFQIIMMPYGIFAVSIATVLYPTLSRHAANKRREEFVSDMALGLRWTLFILLPISLGITVLAMPIIRVLFEHRGGMFTYSDSLFAGDFLEYYALSIAPYALVMFATRVFYSMNDTGTPAIINIVGVVFNAIISYALLKYMGAKGIALGATVTYAATTTASLIMIRQITKGLGGREFWIAVGKMCAAAVLMAMVVHAGEYWSRPDTVVMERGPRLPLAVPATAKAGDSTIISNSNDFARLWTGLGRTTDTLPMVDFEANKLALVWGPASPSTCSLELKSAKEEAAGLKLNLSVHPIKKATTATLTQDLPTSPAYALIQIKNTGKPVQMAFTVEEHASRGSLFQRVASSDLLRLTILIIIGGAVYTISAFLFRMPELELVKDKIMRRFKRG